MSENTKLKIDPQKIYQRLTISPSQIAEFCEKWQIKELALFGSVLREDFKPKSDIDFLVEFKPEMKLDLYSLYEIEQELKTMVKRDIDLVFKHSIETSHNWIRKKSILDTLEIIYEQR